MRPVSREQASCLQASTALSTPPATLVRPDTVVDKRTSQPTAAPLAIQASIQPDDTLAKFSYGPATQTTVVTTTTTTTTEFPPLMLKAPKHLHELDPRHYPLATSPTPRSIRRLNFEVDGQPAVFEEAEDTVQAVDRLNRQRLALAQSNGAICSISTSSDPSEQPQPLSSSFLLADATTTRQNAALASLSKSKNGLKRSASPVSISAAVALATQDGPRKRRQVASVVSDTRSNEDYLQPLLPPRRIQTSTPITPNPGASFSAVDSARRPTLPRADSSIDADVITSSDAFPTSAFSRFEDDPLFLSPKSESGRSEQDLLTNDHGHARAVGPIPPSVWPGFSVGPTITPGPEDGPGNDSFDTALSGLDIRPRPQALDTTAVQDASLPSPSLSPVTAAATLEARRSHLERTPQNAEDSLLCLDSTTIPSQLGDAANSMSMQQKMRQTAVHHAARSSLERALDSSLDNSSMHRSLSSVSNVVDTFEAMPEELKKYVIYQMLRRCAKPALHFVADVVNSALKWDFIKYLPPELSEVILGHLDVKSLCSAAQVSRRWRHQVDSSEKVWKRAFHNDGFILEDGELARAIREGWGWQTISQMGQAEQDLSTLASGFTSSDVPQSPSPQDIAGGLQGRARRSRRVKGRSCAKGGHKKKVNALYDGLDDDALVVMTSATDGPYAAASAAAAAIALPRQDLHLWKSLYMRHHIIRQTWMREEVAPRHIAFRAHQRHVVTCLQFDSEKILTGSDDANINVYDTQTGALRAKLEGHEGGVWALQYEGNILVSGSTDRTVRVWDIERGVCTHTFQGHTSTVRCLQILMPTPAGIGLDGRISMVPKQPLIITGSRDSQLRVWKLPKPDDPAFHQGGPAQDEAVECPYFIRVLTGHHHSVRAIAAYGDVLVSGSYDHTVRVWRISTGETIHRLQGHSQKVYSVVLDHKRNRCISGSMDNVVKVWSLDTGMALFNLEGHSSLVGLLDLQADRLVSAAADSTLRIWNPEHGRCESILSAHTGAITCFQHDGQKVISGSDRTLKMWNASTGEFVKDLLTDLSGVWQVKFNARRCVAAVQRKNFTFIEVLDFGACRDGVPSNKRGTRILVDVEGHEVNDVSDATFEADVADGT